MENLKKQFILVEGNAYHDSGTFCDTFVNKTVQAFETDTNEFITLLSRMSPDKRP